MLHGAPSAWSLLGMATVRIRVGGWGLGIALWLRVRDKDLGFRGNHRVPSPGVGRGEGMESNRQESGSNEGWTSEKECALRGTGMTEGVYQTVGGLLIT